MKRVMIESPYGARTPRERERNDKYLEACIFDSLEKGEAPFASHGLYTHYLKDSDPKEREKGLACGRTWAETADIIAFYVDYGVTPGMLNMLDWIFSRDEYATSKPKAELRRLPEWFAYWNKLTEKVKASE